MSGPTTTTRTDDRVGAAPLFARAANASARARRRRAAEVRDLLSDAEARLDDRTRTAAGACLSALVGAVEGLIRKRAIAYLADHDAVDSADRLAALSIDMTGLLAESGVLSDTALIEEVLGRVGEALLAERLPIELGGASDSTGLVLRLTGSTDPKVADAARAMLSADAARRAEIEGEPSSGDLPAVLRAHLAWPMAAILRSRLPFDTLIDAAMSHAASQVAGSIGEVRSLEGTAMRLAEAIAPDAHELPVVTLEALGDRRLSLAIALLARALATDYTAVRDLVLDPEGERLWLVMRALDFERTAIARVGYLLCEADVRRSTEAFADLLGAIMQASPDEAAEAVAELRLPHPYRDALHLLHQRGMA